MLPSGTRLWQPEFPTKILSRITGAVHYEYGFTITFDLPKSNQCTVDVNTTPTIPTITPGKAVDAVDFTSGATGAGHLTFKPDAFDANGGLLNADNGNQLHYSVVDSAVNTNWNAADAQWRGDLTKDYAIQLGNVPSSTKGGSYKGNMTATISCE